MVNGTIVYPGANVRNLGVIFDSSLGPQFHLSTSPTVEAEHFKICPITLLLMMLAATVLVQATIFTHLSFCLCASQGRYGEVWGRRTQSNPIVGSCGEGWKTPEPQAFLYYFEVSFPS